MSEVRRLSIAVITMNRSKQLVEALDSCLTCKLPENIEFLVLDNASTDDTKSVMMQYIEAHPEIRIDYHYSETNLGVGGGRAFVFEKASGKYVYFLDDDAVIAPESYNTFFVESLAFMDAHPQVASMTTKIDDEIFGNSRNEIASKIHFIDGYPLMFFYLGGSHFLRKAYFNSPLYFSIQYGSEELLPSIQAMDKGYYHVYNRNLCIIHKPTVNKWIDGTTHMRKIIICGVAVVYATKKLLYPRIFHPILWLGYARRCQLHLKQYPGAKQEADAMVRQIIRENPCKKVRITTVIKMYRKFGMTVF